MAKRPSKPRTKPAPRPSQERTGLRAVLNGHAGPVELLLAVGADMDAARLDGMTAIHLAQLPGTPKAIYELMMLGQEEALE